MYAFPIRAAVFAAVLGLAASAQAQDLKIGLASEPTAMDPHYHQATPNGSMTSHIFESLVGHDAKMNLVPGLATSWENLDDNTWKIKLHEGVKFSNGKPLTANDVVFTFCRVMNNEQAVAGSYAAIAQQFASVEVPDDHTLLIKTNKPYPLLPNDLAGLAILWNGIVQHGPITFNLKKKCGVTSPWPAVADFNTGLDAIGTGPYTLKSYVKGTAIELVRNENYWGKKPEWANVKFVPVPSAGPRLAGLLAGDFDLVEDPAARDLKRIKSTPGFDYVVTPSSRVLFLQFDVERNPSPLVKSSDGKNPLQDVRVRRAISMAIDRKTIVSRIMNGTATPAYQFLPDGMFGALPHPPEMKYDPEEAKKLLAEAGYPNGFEMTLSATNDRYINDGQIAQAVAQYLARVGIKVEVDAMTRSVFFPKRATRAFSFAMGGWASDTGEASSFLQFWVTSYAKELGLGTSNYGRYSNPELDKVFRKALVTMDPGERKTLLQEAVTRTLAALPSIPLHFESSAWAFRKGIFYEGRRDQYTLATSVKSSH